MSNSWYARDTIALLAVFTLALGVRLPFIFNPPSIVFDEGLYAATTLNTIYARPVFDIHPPLVKLTFASIVAGAHPIYQPYRNLNVIRMPFGDFPYWRIRFFNAFIGSGLAVLVMGILRGAGQKTLPAALGGIFIALDPALTLYSRLMLPETLLLFFSAFSIFFIVYADRTRRDSFFMAAALMAGLALSIKWTALALVGGILVYIISTRTMKSALYFLSGVASIYIFLWVAFLVQFPPGPISAAEYTDKLMGVEYPGGESLAAIINFLPAYTKVTYSIGSDLFYHPARSTPLTWIAGGGEMNVWGVCPDHCLAVMSGFGWGLILVAVIGAAALFLFGLLGYSVKKFSLSEQLFFVCYVVSLAPLFFLPRSLFIYHYFPSVLFGYLVLISLGTKVMSERLFNRVTVLLIMVMSTTFFLQSSYLFV
ncbi:MAG: phospholipid carrier-dependent glycosyltransferase [Patescibacteria group bacterium]